MRMNTIHGEQANVVVLQLMKVNYYGRTRSMAVLTRNEPSGTRKEKNSVRSMLVL